MRNILVCMLVFFSSANYCLGQIRPDSPKLLATFGPEVEDVLESVDNLALEVKTQISITRGVLAIRVCSPDPLPVAFAMAKGVPVLAASKLEAYGIRREQVIYLRDDEACTVPRDGMLLTEYWFVPEGSELPDYAEARKASDLSVTDIVLSGNSYLDHYATPLTSKTYDNLLKNLAKKLQKDKTAIVLLRVPIENDSGSRMARRINKTVGFLKNRGIAARRILLRKIQFADPEARFPDIVIIKPDLN